MDKSRGRSWKLVRAAGRVLRLPEALDRKRLARAVRGHARAERERGRRAGVVEFASVASRTALYEQICRRLEDLDRPVSPQGLRRLEELLAEPPRLRDYGVRAGERHARIASVLAGLDVERTDALGARVEPADHARDGARSRFAPHG